MKRSPNRGLLVLVLLLALVACRTTGSGSMQKFSPMEQSDSWTLIDSLLQKEDRPRSAEPLLQEVLAAAKANQNHGEAYRALVALVAVTERTEDPGLPAVIAFLDAQSSSLSRPDDAVLLACVHALRAQSLAQYLQQNRWRLLERGMGAEAMPLTAQNLESADLLSLTSAIADAFDRAFAEASALQALPVSAFSAGLENDKAAKDRALRPTLYDLLAHQAIAFYTSQESGLTQPLQPWRLDQEEAFAPSDQVIRQDWSSTDSLDYNFRAWSLYMTLERFHARNANLSANTSASRSAQRAVALDRLAFAAQHSTLPDAAVRYRQALKRNRIAWGDDPLAADAALNLARAYVDAAGAYQPRIGDVPNDPQDSLAGFRRKAAELCRDAIARWPKSPGGRSCAALLYSLELPQLQTTVEGVLLPRTPFLALVEHANVPELHWRVVNDLELLEKENDSERIRRLLKQPDRLAGTQALPGHKDHNTHRLALPLDGLPPGSYQLAACRNNSFDPEKTGVALAAFAVSQIDAWQIAEPDGGVTLCALDRANGLPLQGATAVAFERVYNQQSRRNERQERARGITDAEGRVRLGQQGDINYAEWELTWRSAEGETHTLQSGDRVTWRGDRHRERNRTVSTLFTDRSIYRPGQTVYVKGIVLRQVDGVITGVAGKQSITLSFRNPNGEELESLNLQTNALGSFEAVLTAPASGLTGMCRLETPYGGTSIRVEAYKRPRFSVQLDSVSGAPALGDSVFLNGQAEAFTGTPLVGARVQWRVTREASWPWWYRSDHMGWGMDIRPPGPGRGGGSAAIATGTASTDGDGHFPVAFIALPDETQGTSRFRPAFRFRISATVTDAAGETRSTEKVLTLADAAVQVVMDPMPDTWIKESLPDWDLRLENAVGSAQSGRLTARLIALDPVGRRLRESPWALPEQQVLDYPAFVARYPHDPYDNRHLPAQRKSQRVVWEKEWEQPDRTYRVTWPDRISWPSGEYALLVFGEDEQGRAFAAEQYLTLRGRDEQAVPAESYLHLEADAWTALPGETWRFRIGAPMPDARILVEVKRGSKTLLRQWVQGNGQYRELSLTLSQEDRGGLDVEVLCAYDNRMHRISRRLTVPWSDRELNLAWTSFRDKLSPGEPEQWRLQITGPDGSAAAAEALVGMYDASLDALAPHAWSPWTYPDHQLWARWNRLAAATMHGHAGPWKGWAYPTPGTREYDVLRGWMNMGGYGYFRGRAMRGDMLEDAPVAMAAGNVAEMKSEANGAPPPGEPESPAGPDALPPPRGDLRETAFFYPRLEAGTDGQVAVVFRSPEALTRWNVWALAHDADGRRGLLQRTATTSKELMVTPNFPRYLRAGDRLVVSARVDNRGASARTGRATLQLEDAKTGAPLNAAFGLTAQDVAFSAEAGSQTALHWMIQVPDMPGVVRYTISARTTDDGIPLGDGESNACLLLPNRQRVSETYLLPVTGAGDFRFDSPELTRALADKAKGETAQLTLSFTPNPAWYAVQALPYLMDQGPESAERIFHRYYANRIGSWLVDQQPAMANVLARWRESDALDSPLEKNEDLKSLASTETPWLQEAQDQSARQRRIGVYLDPNRMAYERQSERSRLFAMQLSNGGWPWVPGGRDNVYITQLILTGQGRLRALGVADETEQIAWAPVLERAVQYMDARAKERLDRSPDFPKNYRPSSLDLHYLYTRSFYLDHSFQNIPRKDVDALLERCEKNWTDLSVFEQALLALTEQRFERSSWSDRILVSLLERSQVDPERGRYWPTVHAGYGWAEAPVETQALLLEAFAGQGAEPALLNSMRTWLLQQKRTSDWGNSVATAHACFALLAGRAPLSAEPDAQLYLGGERLSPATAEAGTGWFREELPINGVPGASQGIRIVKTGDGPAWGAVYRQSWQPLDDVSAAGDALQVNKILLRETSGPRGQQWESISAETPLQQGDQLLTRLTISVDRDLEFVHLRDGRAAGLEPMDVLSGYRWDQGMGYYTAARDAGQDWFFDRLPRGTWVFEYRSRAFQPGDFAAGPATLQCLYAPEFMARSAGQRLRIEAP